MSTDRNIGGYEVGYKKPPKHSQFRKGTSGNPGGRPIRIGDFLLALAKVLRQYVTINEGGSVRKITKLAAIVLRIVNRAATGDIDAINILVRWCAKNEIQVEKTPELILILKEQALGRPEGTYEAMRVVKLRRTV